MILELLTYLATIGLGALIQYIKSSRTIKDLLVERNNLASALAYREGQLLPHISPLEQEEIDQYVNDLMHSYDIDRVATMWACNGAAAPTESTSISIKSKTNKHEEYYRTKIGVYHAKYLQDAERDGHKILEVSKLPADCSLANIYRDLGIKHVCLVPVYYESNDKYKIRGWLYMTCSRYSDVPFSSSDIRAILKACKIKGSIFESSSKC
jgi:hypothetical protein